MKAISVLRILTLLCLGTALPCLAKNSSPAYMGIWVLTKTEASITGAHPVIGPSGSLQLALDTSTSEAPVEVSFVFQLAPEGGVIVTVANVLVNGQIKDVHYAWKGEFDAKDYAVMGDDSSDTWSFEKLNDHVLKLSAKKDGRVVRGATLSFYGKKCTVTTGGNSTFYGKMHVKAK